MAPRPARKNKNIHGRRRREAAGDFANSRHTNTPQIAETMVAPCPIAYDTAGPTRLAFEATKLATAPVHQITPPTTPQKGHAPVAAPYGAKLVGGSPVSDRFINKVFTGSEQIATPSAKMNATAYG